ncbi:TetR/AcrR family transcriptional regulator [Methanococcus maripaludis]|uniref:AcrR family transcriptional regulator n=1 Tax=Methanococcus maripaludis TaxID=39152 RepID=A0A8T4CQ15_METMI|nr:TetR/AcrR family transcriptional regulator [Methanococcus maripaludis]MBM7408836.1 AcrR family transcriptional regulator [Methanococcus maripaludis]MBP2218977.1 AcrR family transcriptional regulator [Methanococcus maripaludis]
MKANIEDKRKAIMDAALKLFTERGFHGTSTAQISKEAGVATGTLFHYFPTKEDLINNLYFEVKGDLSQAMVKDLKSQVNFKDKLKKIWDNLIRWGLDNHNEFLFVGQFCNSPYISNFTREEVMKEYFTIHKLIEDGVTDGAVKNLPLKLVIAMFYQNSRTVVQVISGYGLSKDKNKIINEGFEVIWTGLSKN